MQVLLLMGPPGAGKGTQSQRLAQRLGLELLVMGDLLREEIRRETPLGQEIRAIVESGALVPDPLVIRLIEARLCSGKHYILDGFPRTIPQAQALEALLARLHAHLCAAISLEVPHAELLERLLRRSQIEGRADDKPETIEKRLMEYQQKTQPLLDYYSERKALHVIDGTGPIEAITERILSTVQNCFKK